MDIGFANTEGGVDRGDSKRSARSVIPIGISLPRTTAERIDALTGVKPGNRSERWLTVLLAGMRSLYGDEWQERAECIRQSLDEQVPA